MLRPCVRRLFVKLATIIGGMGPGEGVAMTHMYARVSIDGRPQTAARSSQGR